MLSVRFELTSLAATVLEAAVSTNSTTKAYAGCVSFTHSGGKLYLAHAASQQDLLALLNTGLSRCAPPHKPSVCRFQKPLKRTGSSRYPHYRESIVFAEPSLPWWRMLQRSGSRLRSFYADLLVRSAPLTVSRMANLFLLRDTTPLEWWAAWDLNPGPDDYESTALTD